MIASVAGSSSSASTSRTSKTHPAAKPKPVAHPPSTPSSQTAATHKTAAWQLGGLWGSILGGSGSGRNGASSIISGLADYANGAEAHQASTSGQPVVSGDNPDPQVLEVKSKNGQPTYYETNTQSGTPGLFPIRESTNLKNWKTVGSIFPAGQGPQWAIPNGQNGAAYWAPEIHQVGTFQSGPNQGKPQYVAYYSARDQDGTLAIGCATSASPKGPFNDVGQPLVENGANGQNGALNSNQAPVSGPGGPNGTQGSRPVSAQQAMAAKGQIGLIDPTYFKDPSTGKQYLIYKVDGNSANQTTPIMAQQLNPQGTGVVGQPTQLMSNTQNWQGPVSEAPEVTKHGNYYYLFTAGNTYDTSNYAVGAARSTSFLGPYTQHDGPVYQSSPNDGANGGQTAPGHGDVVSGPDGQDYWFYAAYAGAASSSGQRQDFLAPIDWGTNPNDWPTFGNNGQPYTAAG